VQFLNKTSQNVTQLWSFQSEAGVCRN